MTDYLRTLIPTANEGSYENKRGPAIRFLLGSSDHRCRSPSSCWSSGQPLRLDPAAQTRIKEEPDWVADPQSAPEPVDPRDQPSAPCPKVETPVAPDWSLFDPARTLVQSGDPPLTAPPILQV